MCKPSTGCPRGRLPNRGVIRGMEEAGHILHWKKVEITSGSLGKTYLGPRNIAGTLCANKILKRIKGGIKDLRQKLFFCILTSVLSEGAARCII